MQMEFGGMKGKGKKTFTHKMFFFSVSTTLANYWVTKCRKNDGKEMFKLIFIKNYIYWVLIQESFTLIAQELRCYSTA